jgi:hypothetical protein
MSRLCKFTELRSNKDIFVNPTLVEYVRPASGNTGAHIYFAKEHLIWVDLPVEMTTKALERALDRRSQSESNPR